MATIDEIMKAVFASQSVARQWSLGRATDDDEINANQRVIDMITSAIADAFRAGAESMRDEAADCAISAGRGSLAEEIRAILPPAPGGQS
jgi:hypothetical protein